MKFIDCVIKQNILTTRSSELGVPIALFLFEWGWARATSSEGVDVNVMSVLDLQSRDMAPQWQCIGLSASVSGSTQHPEMYGWQRAQ